MQGIPILQYFEYKNNYLLSHLFLSFNWVSESKYNLVGDSFLLPFA